MSAENETLVATQLQQLEEKKENAAIVDFKMVTFSLADKDYSIDIMHVKEIAKAGRFTYVPNTLPFVLGVYNLRGEIIPILDLRIFFNIEVPPREENKLENMLILQVEDQKFGVVVDKIDKVIGVQKSSIQPPHPLFGDINMKIDYGKRVCDLIKLYFKLINREDLIDNPQDLVFIYNANRMNINDQTPVERYFSSGFARITINDTRGLIGA